MIHRNADTPPYFNLPKKFTLPTPAGALVDIHTTNIDWLADAMVDS